MMSRRKSDSRDSRSPSVGVATTTTGGKNRRKITVIGESFQFNTEENVAQNFSPFSPPAILPPPEIISRNSHGNHARYPSSDTSSSVSTRPRALTTSPTCTSRSSSEIRSPSFNGTHHASSSQLQLNNGATGERSYSPLSFKSATSTSSLVEVGVASLIQQPSSEKTIIKDIKREMTNSYRRTTILQKEVEQLPKLRNNIEQLHADRDRLLNELLEQKAIVLQLKQRITLLHEQNQELAKLAQTNDHGGSAPILAIRNTLVATLAQLKQMEDQIQKIPLLNKQIADLIEENASLKEKEKAMSLQLPAQLPEGVSVSDYQTLQEENEMLLSTNHHLMSEMATLREHVYTLSGSCEGLQKRMSVFQTTQSSTRPLQEKIKKLEAEKEALHKEVIELKFQHTSSSLDIDMAHLTKELKTTKKKNNHLKAKLEQMKVDGRQQKEQLVLKLFEIEALNVKTSRYEMNKKLLDIQQQQVMSADNAVVELVDIEEDPDMKEVPPEARAQLLRFKQLEVHSQETENLLKAILADKTEMENRISELLVQVQDRGITKLERKLETSESKLEIAREKVHSLEERLRNLMEEPDGETSGQTRNQLLAQISAMEQEIERLSTIGQDASRSEGHLKELIETKQLCEGLQQEKDKLEKKAKDSRSRLKSLASQVSQSAELVKSYQEQCIAMQKELDRVREEKQELMKESADARATLEVSKMEQPVTTEDVTTATINDLQEKYDTLSSKLTHLTEQHEQQTHKLSLSEENVLKLSDKLTDAKSAETALSQDKSLLQDKVQQLEMSLEEATNLHKEKLQETSKILANKAKKVVELEVQLDESKSSHNKLDHQAQSLREDLETTKQLVTSLQSEKQLLQQKVELLSSQTPTLVQESVELRTKCEETESKLEAAVAEREALSNKVTELTEQLQASGNELRSKLRLLEEGVVTMEDLKRQCKDRDQENKQLKEEMATLRGTMRTNESDMSKQDQVVKKQAEKIDELTASLKRLQENSEKKLQALKKVEEELKETRSEEVPKLHSELAKTMSEMGQLTTDYASRVAQLRDQEARYNKLEEEKKVLQTHLDALQTKESKSEAAIVTLTNQVADKDDEIKELKSTHSKSLGHSQKLMEETNRLKDDCGSLQRKLVMQEDKMVKSNKSMQEEVMILKEKVKMCESKETGLQNVLQLREQELNKAYDKLATQTKEIEQVRKTGQNLENQCEMLSATRDNLLNRLDRMEKLEMEYECLKHKVQEVIGQSSQLKSDNRALLQLLEGIEIERPALEREATKNLQEENCELHQQVSLLSQWNDKNQRAINTLEQQLENMEEEKRKVLADMDQMQSCEQENRQLKKELREVEIEVNRLKRHAHAEVQEEMKIKVDTQTQLLSILSEHNRALQLQVAELMKQIVELGGKLSRDRPVSPPPLPEPSDNAPYVSMDARRCAELELLNSSLQQQLGQLKAELFAAQEISPKVRRRSSAIFAASSVASVATNEDAFVSVPSEMLLPCSVLADYFANNTELSTDFVEPYLKAIGEGWFTVVASKSVTDDCLKSYTSTFGRLSTKLLDVIINLQDMRGNTALHHTLANGNFKAVSVLLSMSWCNANITNKAGYTPLMLVAAHNIDFTNEQRAVLKQLLTKTDVNIKSKVELQTALMLAVCSCNVDLVAMFLEGGANINEQDKDGSTALMFACEKGSVDIVQKLISNPTCNIALKDNDGQNAHDIAASYSYKEVCTILKKRSKSLNKKR